jgi:hypothetical protein
MKHLLKVTARKIEETFVNIYTNKEELFNQQSIILQYDISNYRSIILN